MVSFKQYLMDQDNPSTLDEAFLFEANIKSKIKELIKTLQSSKFQSDFKEVKKANSLDSIISEIESTCKVNMTSLNSKFQSYLNILQIFKKDKNINESLITLEEKIDLEKFRQNVVGFSAYFAGYYGAISIVSFLMGAPLASIIILLKLMLVSTTIFTAAALIPIVREKLKHFNIKQFISDFVFFIESLIFKIHKYRSNVKKGTPEEPNNHYTPTPKQIT